MRSTSQKEPLTPEDRVTIIKAEYEKQQKRKKTVTKLFLELLAVGFVTYIVFGVIFGVAVVDGDSMSPDIRPGSIVFFLRLKQPQKGDVLIFTSAGDKKYLIKRVIALSGDTVSIDDKNSEVTIDNKPESAAYVVGKTGTESSVLKYPVTVPVESVFVLGDNREHSTDSRQLGMINLRRVVGTSLLVLKLR